MKVQLKSGVVDIDKGIKLLAVEQLDPGDICLGKTKSVYGGLGADYIRVVEGYTVKDVAQVNVFEYEINFTEYFGRTYRKGHKLEVIR